MWAYWLGACGCGHLNLVSLAASHTPVFSNQPRTSAHDAREVEDTALPRRAMQPRCGGAVHSLHDLDFEHHVLAFGSQSGGHGEFWLVGGQCLILSGSRLGKNKNTSPSINLEYPLTEELFFFPVGKIKENHLPIDGARSADQVFGIVFYFSYRRRFRKVFLLLPNHSPYIHYLVNTADRGINLHRSQGEADAAQVASHLSRLRAPAH